MTQEEQLAQLIKSDPAKLRQMLSEAHTEELRESYAHHLKADDGTPVVSLTVDDWRSIQMLLGEVPSATNNPGGPAFQHLLDDCKSAIAAKDADRLFMNLLLIYKAIGRS